MTLGRTHALDSAGAGRYTIGIIITCYNYARYVGRAIDSVLEQTCGADEIIVVDDGSTDGSRDVIASYGSRVRPIFQPNAGHVAARNAGFTASTTDIVIFLDADDVLLPNAIAEVLRRWTSKASKLQFDLEIIDADGLSLSRRFCNFASDYDSEAIHEEFRRTGTYRWPVTSGNAYARAFLATLMPMQPPQSQDGVLNTLAPLYGEVLTVSEPLGQYRHHGASVSRARLTTKRVACPDFPKRIAIRRAEFEILRQHADALGLSLPAGNPLDQEIVFVNYRLMARKLNERYSDDERDSAWRLFTRGLRLSWSDSHPLRARAAHSVWFILLGLCPARVAPTLVELRFDRSNVMSRLRDKLRLGRRSDLTSQEAQS